MNLNKGVIKRDSVIAMLAEVEEAQREVKEGFALLLKAKGRLSKTLGQYHDYIIQHHMSDYELGRQGEASAKLIERNAWKSVVTRLQVREIVSVKKREALDEQLEKGELPPLTVENVYAFMQQLFQDMDSLLEDSAREVFDWLRPRWRTELKTNEKNKFGLTDKVILTGGMSDNWGGMPRHLNHYWDKYYQVLDNVFHLLDGQGVAQYPNDICTLVSSAGEKGLSECVTDYFELKWFKNRNLHIKFRRMDLVNRLNGMAGSGMLREDEHGNVERATG